MAVDRKARAEVAHVAADGREPYDRTKIVSGLRRACEKRPVSMETIEGTADRIERGLQERGEREVTSRDVGEFVMQELHDIAPVAYVRFASVYRSFGDVHEFMAEVKALMAKRRQGAGRRRRPAPASRRRTA